MTRSRWKGIFVDWFLYKKVRQLQRAGTPQRIIKTWSRRSTIPPEFVGCNFRVHNGNRFIKVAVTEPMVGRKLGEFAPTRKYPAHPDKFKSSSGSVI